MVIEVQPPWKMYFDGVAHRVGAGAGVVFVTSQGEVLPYSFTLSQLCSNNVAEYQTLILGLEIAVEMKQLQLQVFGDSQLVVNELLGSYEVKKPELRPYHDCAKNLIGWLGDVTIQHKPRKENKKDNALAALDSSLTLSNQAQVTVCQKWVVPPPNEAEAEAFNKTLCNLLKKVVSKSKWDLHDRMEEDLWAYRTTHRTPTQATPYAPVYGFEAVLPLECQILSLRLPIQEGITHEENARLQLAELEALDEKRLEAQQSLEWKFTSKWDGPYVVQEAYSSGAYKLVDADGMRIGPINSKFLKKYYP
ncbi:uncharacterized protein [Nicotiana tomentosiformis]|uniref:uncharacterized protein n=1 Tax=Nicotiana tomentosiformis TaxID=4098 RepID=UPI00388C41FB